MARISKSDAAQIASNYALPLNVDFHALPSDVVQRIIAAADFRNYRRSRNANGSRARYFHAYLVRAYNGRED